jgi:hypothetical protein
MVNDVVNLNELCKLIFLNNDKISVSKTTKELVLRWQEHKPVDISSEVKMPQFEIFKVIPDKCQETFHIGKQSKTFQKLTCFIINYLSLALSSFLDSRKKKQQYYFTLFLFSLLFFISVTEVESN